MIIPRKAHTIMKRNKKGFTIVELVIVIAVIGVLSAILIPVFINLTNKANDASDQSLVKNLNTILAMKEQEEGYEVSNNPSEMFKVLKSEGYDGEVLLKRQKSGKKILYNLPKNRFLFEEDKNNGQFTNKGEDFWEFKDVASFDTTNGYSLYLNEEFLPNGKINATAGLDLGFNEEAVDVEYNRASASDSKTVAIRTNNGTLTINAIHDKVYHYGTADIVDIQAVDTGSYYENGIVSMAKIKYGRLVVTEKSVLTSVHVVETGGNFTNIKVGVVGHAELPSFTRDDVTIPNNSSKLVLEVQTLETPTSIDNNPEFIWVSKAGELITTDVATSGTVLDDTTKVPAAEQTEVAKASKTEVASGITEEELEQMEEVTTKYAGGMGTSANPYILSTKAHFGSLDLDVNEGTTNGKYYKLSRDIDLGKIYPIGSAGLVGNNGSASQSYTITYTIAFRGTFDGNGHQITYNLLTDSGLASGSNAVGLFGAIEDATVKNLTVNADLEATRASVWGGGLAGFGWGANLENVTVNGRVKVAHDAGGFFGYYSIDDNLTATFTNCTNNAEVICNSQRNGTYALAGGFIGQYSPAEHIDAELNFVNCHSNGDIRVIEGTRSSFSPESYFVAFCSDNAADEGQNIVFNFTNCTIDEDAEITSVLGNKRTNDIYCAAIGEAVTHCPVISYLGITSNKSTTSYVSSVKVYVDSVLQDMSLYNVA